MEHGQIEIFTLDSVEYLFFGYKVTFDEALTICVNYKGQLAILNSKEKAEFVIRAMTNILGKWLKLKTTLLYLIKETIY